MTDDFKSKPPVHKLKGYLVYIKQTYENDVLSVQKDSDKDRDIIAIKKDGDYVVKSEIVRSEF